MQRDVFKIIQPSCWMVSVDLKDAFYSIPVNENFPKILKFKWVGELYVNPTGYSEARRIFATMLKPTFATLRNKVSVTIYL